MSDWISELLIQSLIHFLHEKYLSSIQIALPLESKPASQCCLTPCMMRFAFSLAGLLLSFTTTWAEPLRPMLDAKSVDSLMTLLQRSRPDTNRVNLLLALSNDIITRHEELSGDLEKAYTYAKQAEQLSLSLQFKAGQLQSQITLGRILGYNGNRSKGEALLRKALAYYRTQQDKPEQATVWYFLGQMYDRTIDELPEKIECYQQAMRLFGEAGLVSRQAYMLKMIADMHLLQGNTSRAEQELFQVLALYKSARYPYLHYTYDLLSSIYHTLSNYDQALKYELMTIESATATHDSIYLGSFNLNLGILYDELKQWQTALTYYKTAMLLFGEMQDTSMVHIIAHSICGVLIAHESPKDALTFYAQTLQQYPIMKRSDWFEAYMTLAECHLALGHYALAETFYQKMLATQSNKQVIDNPTIASYIKVGTFYRIVKQYDKARAYLNKALALLRQVGFKRGTPSVYLQLFKLDSAQHNYLAAIDNYQQYKTLSDSIFNEKKSQQIANLEIQYNTQKKEQNIALLTRQNLLQQARIREKDLQRNSVIAVTVLLTLLLGLFYNRYRFKQRSNRLLEIKQHEINRQNQSLQQILQEKDALLDEKEWMLKEIHHRVKNNLQIITSMLNAQADFLQDPKALMAIRDSQNRVHAMALIHQKLYQSENLARVNMAEFIREITDYLVESFPQNERVRTILAVDPVQLDVALAIPIGLIINEVVTNSLKYAFPEGRSGQITIVLRLIEEHRYELTIADNGVGLPPGFNINRSDTLGLTMIRGLSRQIGGQLLIDQDEGVSVRLMFSTVRKTDKAGVVTA